MSVCFLRCDSSTGCNVTAKMTMPAVSLSWIDMVAVGIIERIGHPRGQTRINPKTHGMSWIAKLRSGRVVQNQ
ncbi:hypothetical protein TNIN_304651 [Trichonephila inaurata madagascariensis]|uniref:Uncharacterized protein n=1 Tax=Trichonephila inaurata madagascariensis TaxID=2747483 RepID=A0A8X7CBX0_9ARAC|nr:hypothetical protein TNIN_304651 [Trichonephila inaurata madagascariensis]